MRVHPRRQHSHGRVYEYRRQYRRQENRGQSNQLIELRAELNRVKADLRDELDKVNADAERLRAFMFRTARRPPGMVVTAPRKLKPRSVVKISKTT